MVRGLTLETASRGGALVWRWLAPLNKRHRRADEQLRLAYPERDAAWRSRTLRDVWSNLGATFAESFLLDRLVAAPDRFSVVASEELDAALSDQEQGVVLACLHTGNWEVAIMPVVWLNRRPAGIYQKIRNPLVDADIRASRAGLFSGGILEKGASTARQALRIAKAGGVVGIMSDLRDRRGVAVDFFGRPAPSTPFPATIARMTGATLVAARVVRTGPARFVVEGAIVDVPRTASREADITRSTQDLHAVFERWIREHPGQWMWGHRRWGAVAIRSERRNPSDNVDTDGEPNAADRGTL